MQIFTIELKPFKTLYFRTILMNLVLVIGAFVLVETGYTILSSFDTAKKLTSPILTVLIFVALAHSIYQQKKLKQIQAIEDFDLKLTAFHNLYKSRIYWYFFSCLVSCMFYMITGKQYFLYFAILDILLCLPLYPNSFIFKKELQNEDIVFIK